jgi:hypothetical protein
MTTQNQRGRIKKAELAAERHRFSQVCICFPQKEQPRFPFPIMQEIAARIECPLHGERFTPQGSIYTSKWRRENLWISLEDFHSKQYLKAWCVSFPSDLWPAEEVRIGDKIQLRLKDGTVLPTEPETKNREDASKAKLGGIQVLGNPLLNRFKWDPQSKAQQLALDCPADLLLIGGAAGSLKTATLLIDSIQEFDNRRMNAYFFRKSYPELEDTIAQAQEMFSQMGAKYNDAKKLIVFPSGAKLHFRYVQAENDLYQNHGKEMSSIAIDESTHFPEKWARYLLTRNRSVDPNLKVRMRLGTNPGNIGNTWHKKLFFGGVCPHCTPPLAPPQGVPFFGAKWSDGIPLDDSETGVRISVAYILSSVRDHALLGKEYIARLKMQKPSTAKALLDGCWNISEGQYFDIFDPTRASRPMVVPRRQVGEQWWWPRWVSCDYGFSISVAAAHLFVHEPPSGDFPRGRTYIFAELAEQRKNPAELARQIATRWGIQEDEEYPYRWMPWYLSPDSFSRRDSELTIAGQINKALEECHPDVAFTPAANDREGGATRMYTGLQSGELVICAECPKTIEAISTRMRDPNHENDVLKVRGDELDSEVTSTIGANNHDFSINQLFPGGEFVQRRPRIRVPV